VQAGQRRAGRVGVAEAGVRGPADRVAVQVDAVRDLVDLVAEFPAPQHGLSIGQPQHGRDRLSPHAQVTGEGVFGRELGGGADAEVVALDEDGRIAVPDQRGGGHRARAAPGHHGLAAQAARVTGPAQDPAQLAVRQRGPVGFGQLTAHAVDGVRPRDGTYTRDPRYSGVAFAHRSPGSPRGQRASPPTSKVTAAATAKDRIEADIQLAGVKPMSCPNELHAEAHQDTYPGLMSW